MTRTSMTCTMRKTITLVVTAVGEAVLPTQTKRRRTKSLLMRMSLRRMTMVSMHTMRAMTIIEAPTARESSHAAVVTPMMMMTVKSSERPRRDSLRSRTPAVAVVVRAVLAAQKVRRCSSYPQACPPTRPYSTTTITATEPHRAEAVVVVIIAALLTATARSPQPLQHIYP